MVFTNIIIGYRSKRQKKIWEARGQYNALYTTWASERNINSYQLFVLYAIDGYDVITQKMIAAYTGLSKQTVNTVIRALKESGYIGADQPELLAMTNSALQKLENISDKEFAELELYPDF